MIMMDVWSINAITTKFMLNYPWSRVEHQQTVLFSRPDFCPNAASAAWLPGRQHLITIIIIENIEIIENDNYVSDGNGNECRTMFVTEAE